MYWQAIGWTADESRGQDRATSTSIESTCKSQTRSWISCWGTCRLWFGFRHIPYPKCKKSSHCCSWNSSIRPYMFYSNGRSTNHMESENAWKEATCIERSRPKWKSKSPKNHSPWNEQIRTIRKSTKIIYRNVKSNKFFLILTFDLQVTDLEPAMNFVYCVLVRYSSLKFRLEMEVGPYFNTIVNALTNCLLYSMIISSSHQTNPVHFCLEDANPWGHLLCGSLSL